ncbi:hypothetical protein DID88_003129 [Monilinia fructigena]|uniref:Uncharacterized protein n=1 Tax=Monilinia fructigena TaxID=38457 RepID=A0A395IUX2_9HELO|nr:hypothetical protein DID88_003129 [Monilinia fructigena]
MRPISVTTVLVLALASTAWALPTMQDATPYKRGMEDATPYKSKRGMEDATPYKERRTTIILAVTIYYRYDTYQEFPKNTPAYDAALYNIVTIDSSTIIRSPFSGNPGPAVDKAWDDLMSSMSAKFDCWGNFHTRPGINIRISEDDLRKVNGTSIKLADGSNDYWGSIEVYHHLHCLKVIRHYIAKDYYPDAQKFVTEPGMIYPEHIEHCIQTLREHLICIDWSNFEAWSDQRRFSEYDERGLLRKDDGTIWDPRKLHS